MEEPKGVLFVRKSKDGKTLFIRNNDDRLLGKEAKVVLVSRKHVVQLLKNDRDWVIATVLGEVEK